MTEATETSAIDIVVRAAQAAVRLGEAPLLTSNLVTPTRNPTRPAPTIAPSPFKANSSAPAWPTAKDVEPPSGALAFASNPLVVEIDDFARSFGALSSGSASFGPLSPNAPRRLALPRPSNASPPSQTDADARAAQSGQRRNLTPHDAPVPVHVGETVGSLIEFIGGEVQVSETVKDFVRNAVGRALAIRSVPEQDLQWPRIDVLVPSLEALRYTSARDEIANLIASSMDGRTAHTVLPAYVGVLKELSADEIELMRVMPAIGRFEPVADLYFRGADDQMMIASRNLVSPRLAGKCTHRDNLSQYIDNLLRLTLVMRPTGQRGGDEDYAEIEQLAFVRETSRQAPQRTKPFFDKGVLGLTDFGDRFRKACF